MIKNKFFYQKHAAGQIFYGKHAWQARFLIKQNAPQAGLLD